MKKIEMSLPELPFAMEEALNKLRINIRFCGADTKKILVLSTLENEGKSFVAVQLWRMLSEAGLPSVLVDLDLRKSILKRRHEYKSEQDIVGIDYFLSGQADVNDIIYETNCENGYIIPCSNLLENPSSLLEDSRLDTLLDKLAEKFRFVIIDAPPLENVSDGIQLAHYCDGAILVVRSGETSRKLIRHSLQQLERVNCRLLGTVLNRVKATSRAYYRYYGKYGRRYYSSSYRYGYGPDEKDSDN